MTGPGPSSTIITALEQTWAEIRDKHPDVPEVVFISGRGRKKLDLTLGHWRPEAWPEFGAANNILPEVFVSGECMAQGASRVLQTLLHEAAHGVAHVRGIKDTSRGNRYHNQRFVQVAVELGLEGPEVGHETRGWSDCSITPDTENSYESFDALADALVVCIGEKLDLGPAAAGPPKEGKPKTKYECGCPERVIRMSAKVFDLGPILCGLCDQPFLESVG